MSDVQSPEIDAPAPALVGEIRYRQSQDGLFEVCVLDEGLEFVLMSEKGVSLERIEQLGVEGLPAKMLKGEGRASLDGDEWRLISVVRLGGTPQPTPASLDSTGEYIFLSAGHVVQSSAAVGAPSAEHSYRQRG